MAKVFTGNKFLDDSEVKLELSNGFTTTIRELSDEAMASVKKFESVGNDLDGTKIRSIFAGIITCEESELTDVGLVEMQGAISFLFESLFNLKSAD